MVVKAIAVYIHMHSSYASKTFLNIKIIKLTYYTHITNIKSIIVSNIVLHADTTPFPGRHVVPHLIEPHNLSCTRFF